MKHIETHSFYIEFCRTTLSDYRLALFQELEEFRRAWPHADVNVSYNYITIGYTNHTKCYEMARCAANQFREAVKRHDWWKEIE